MENQLRSLRLRDVKKVLTEPEAETFAPSAEYGATFDALGLYSPTQFVTRLNPKTHELVDALGALDLEGRDPDEVFSATQPSCTRRSTGGSISGRPRASS